MNRMRKCNDEVYQLAKGQALVKKLKNKRFRPFCLCLPGVMFVTRGSKNSLYVTSLYTNIPHDDGIAACRKIWEQRTDQEPPTECLVEMLTLVLKNNNFTF
jgi:hypothetical protein